jgi:hypothetical protein
LLASLIGEEGSLKLPGRLAEEGEVESAESEDKVDPEVAVVRLMLLAG